MTFSKATRLFSRWSNSGKSSSSSCDSRAVSSATARKSLACDARREPGATAYRLVVIGRSRGCRGFLVHPLIALHCMRARGVAGRGQARHNFRLSIELNIEVSGDRPRGVIMAFMRYGSR